ncbi:MAG: GMC family oxidoreductase [Deltaproteobacteria bacterium]|nr:GMC family oxidoreductase [Deltaproteobacteria bacterium]
MLEKEFDIVIIGSGSGGGVVASELSPMCRDGVRIAVLEWGPKLKPAEFTGREIEMVGRLYAEAGGFFTKDGDMTIAFGRAYGGSTVVYTGTSLKIAKETVEKWAVPGLEFDNMDRRAEKFFRENNLHLIEDSLINENNRLFVEGCRKLGYRTKRFPVNVKGCKGSSLCNLGCPHGAKQGTDQVQLPAAEKNGVLVVTNCKVEHLGNRECLAVVSEPGFGEPSAWAPGEYRIKAKIVVACGGAINTPALLIRSRLPAALPALGKFITLHPALILVGLHDRPIANFLGHPKSFCCDHFAGTHGFLLETCIYFPFTTAKSCIGFGAEHAELMAHMDRQQQIIALAWDQPLERNRVTVDRKGDPVLDYRASPLVLDALHRAQIEAARIFFASGAARVHAPAGRKFFVERSEAAEVEDLIPRSGMLPGKISLTSAHVMGGCRMGRDPETSVTDGWGRVHGVPWLYVADASLFPRCSEANPYLTIMALADRVAERVRSDTSELLR